MNIILESNDNYVMSILENKLNENEDYIVFNVFKELGNLEDYGKNKPLPLFQSFIAKFDNAMKLASSQNKSLVLEGLGAFFKEGKLSILEKSFVEWSLSQFGCVVLDLDNAENKEIFSGRFPRIQYNSQSDFVVDLKKKLDAEEGKYKDDYIIKTFRALETSGNFIGNFNAKILHPLKKVELDTIGSKVFELGNVEETIDQFQRGEIAFYKNSHPFEIFLRLHAKNQRS